MVQRKTDYPKKNHSSVFQVRQLQGDPLALSYWLASNLPLEDDTRQRLLEAPTVVERSLPCPSLQLSVLLHMIIACQCWFWHTCGTLKCNADQLM